MQWLPGTLEQIHEEQDEEEEKNRIVEGGDQKRRRGSGSGPSSKSSSGRSLVRSGQDGMASLVWVEETFVVKRGSLSLSMDAGKGTSTRMMMMPQVKKEAGKASVVTGSTSVGERGQTHRSSFMGPVSKTARRLSAAKLRLPGHE